MYTGKIGIVGFGHLGFALYQGFKSAGYEVLVNNGTESRTEAKLKSHGVRERIGMDIDGLAMECEVLCLCVTQDDFHDMMSNLHPYLRDSHIVLSFMAQAELEDIEKEITYRRVHAITVKVMTTLGVFNRSGITAFRLPERLTAYHSDVVHELIESISAKGCIFKLKTEKQLQLFTIGVGCMPGNLSSFLMEFLEALNAEEPEAFLTYKACLPTMLRSIADLLDKAESPLELRRRVATAGGVTHAMTIVLKRGEFRRIIREAIAAGMLRMTGKRNSA